MILPRMISGGIPPVFWATNFRRIWTWSGASRRLAREKNCTPGQLRLAWLQAQGEDIIPIPGTRRRKYLEENVACVKG